MSMLRWIGLRLRLIGLLLSSCLLLAGCIPAERRASNRQSLVTIGMTQEDVRGLLGGGESWTADDGGDGDMWHYSYGSVPDSGKIALQTLVYLFLAATIFGLLVLVSAGGGTVPEFDSPNGGVKPVESSGRIHFFVYFDLAGRVRRVSGTNPCHDR